MLSIEFTKQAPTNDPQYTSMIARSPHKLEEREVGTAINHNHQIKIEQIFKAQIPARCHALISHAI